MVMVAVLVYAPVYYSVLSEFGTKGINLKACSMNHLSDVPGEISVLGYLIIKNLLRILGLVIMMMLVFFVSSKAKSMISTICISVVLFILPIILFMADIPGAKYILLNYLII